MSSIETRRDAPAIPTPASAAILRAPDPMAAFFWVTLSMLLFAVLAAASRKVIALGYDPLQVVFLRNVSALLLMLPMLLWRGMSLIRSNAFGLYGVRVAISLVSMTAWFYALPLMPLGEITAIGFLSPLFGTLSAIILLGEKVKLRRWSALIIGFIGAMIILRPGAASLGIGQACALVSAIAGGLIAALLKQLANRDDPAKIVFITTAMMTPMSLLPALLVWRPVGLDALPLLGLVAIVGVLGHMSLMRAFRVADASLIMTFEFSRLPFVVGLGYWFFAELIDVWTWVGASIIVASAAYITHREAKVKREGRK